MATAAPQLLADATAGTPIPPALLGNLIGVESSGNPASVNPATGAAGLGQVLPSTAANPGFGVAPLPANASPEQQAKFAAQYLYARGKAAGLSDADFSDPNKVKVALSAYHGPQTDADGVNGQQYASNVISGTGAGGTASALGTGYGPTMVANTIAANDADRAKSLLAQQPLYDQMVSNMQKDQSRFDKIADSYKPYEPPPPPKAPVNDPFSGFASAAGIFATIAAAFTHTPAIAAMNGMAAAINARKQNDWQAYQTNYQRWKDATDNMLAQHKLQSDDMKSAMDMMQSDLATGMAMVKSVAAKTDDQIASRLADQGEYEKLFELQTARNNAAVEAQKNAVAIQEAQPLLAATAGLTNAQNALQIAQKSGDPQAIDAAQEAVQQAQQQYAFAKNPTSAEGHPGTPQYVTSQIYQQIKRDHPETSDADAWSQAETRQQQAIAAGKPETSSSAKEKDADTLAAGAFAKQYGHPPDPDNSDDQSKMATLREQARATSGGVISDDAANLIAGRVIAGDEQATTGLARNPATMAKVQEAIVKQAQSQGLSPEEINDRIAEFQGTRAAARTLGTRQANMEVAANEVKRMAPLALAASQNVNRTNYPTFNKILIDAQRGSGDANVVRFGLAANSLIYEYAKFLNPTGIPTDSDKARATDILSTAWSQGQFSAAIQQIQREISVGQQAITDTRGELNSGLTTATGSAKAAPPAAQSSPLPMVMQGGQSVPDASKLKDGQVYVLPGGQKAKFDESRMGFTPIQ